MNNLLTILTFIPLVGALITLMLPKGNVNNIRHASLAFCVINFAVSLLLLSKFSGATYHFQMVEDHPWIPAWGVHYKLGVDGISVWLVVLTTFLSVISTWFSYYVKTRVKEYMFYMLLLQTTMLGVFLSLDLVLFYVFFEASLIPMFFLINIWGGERRSYAAIKFFLYTFTGSIFMLVGLIAMSQIYKNQFGTQTFDLIAIQHAVSTGQFWAKTAMSTQVLLFWSFAVAFMVKTPMFPFHTWLPDAHVEAPTAGSVILAGVLLKMGTYGFLRLCLPLFPEAVQSQVLYLTILAVVGIIYGAIVAAVQPDVKKLVAYSSVAHMGFVMLGICSLTHFGMLGGTYQQLSHGISTGALFLLIGLIYERRHTRMFKDFGGLKAQMPIYSTMFLIIMLSSVGLPGLNGFVGEFMALLGSFQAGLAGKYNLNLAFPVIAGIGVILAAVYLLIMFMKMFYGPNDNPENKSLKDLKPWEMAMVGSLVVLAIVGGLLPNIFTGPMEKSVQATRMMATSLQGARPSWSDETMEIGDKGELMSKGKKINDPDLYNDIKNEEVVAR